MSSAEALPDEARLDENGQPTHWRYGDVQRRLRVGRTEIRRLIDRGLLRTVPGKDNWRVYFVAKEVEQLAVARYDHRPNRRPGVAKPKDGKRNAVGGTVAARVFKLLDEGADLSRVVREAKVTPELARVLWREWKVSFEQGEQEEQRQRAQRIDREQQREHDKFMFKQAKARAASRVARRAQASSPVEHAEEDRSGEPNEGRRVA